MVGDAQRGPALEAVVNDSGTTALWSESMWMSAKTSDSPSEFEIPSDLGGSATIGPVLVFFCFKGQQNFQWARCVFPPSGLGSKCLLDTQ